MAKSKSSSSTPRKKYRKPVAAGTKKEEAAFKTQYTRTQVMNALASAVNLIAGVYAKRLKPGSFYSLLQSSLRKESRNDRVLLLNELDGMEINEKYRFTAICSLPEMCIIKTNAAFEIKLAVDHHPNTRIKDINCYYFEVVLAVWGRGGVYTHRSKKSCWIDLEKDRPHFTFCFERPLHANEYMILIRVSLGYNQKELDIMLSQGTMIYETGSFTKQGQNLLAGKKKSKQEELRNAAIKPKKQEEERVMPDGYV